jgi:hypothetical protein
MAQKHQESDSKKKSHIVIPHINMKCKVTRLAEPYFPSRRLEMAWCKTGELRILRSLHAQYRLSHPTPLHYCTLHCTFITTNHQNSQKCSFKVAKTNGNVYCVIAQPLFPRDLRLPGGGLSLPQTRAAHSSYALPPSNKFCFQILCYCGPFNFSYTA